MKKIILPAILLPAITIAFFVACNNPSAHDTSQPADTASQPVDTAKTAAITPSFTSLDPKAAAAIKTIIDDYLRVKNSLATDNSSGAATAAQALYGALTIDTTLFTPDQRTLYDQQQQILKDDAQHIGKSSDIEHQRSHFAMMNDGIYALVKGFGGGRLLYHDHCPMYNDGKGAGWLSETVAIKNPYLGGKMPDCGTVEATIR